MQHYITIHQQAGFAEITMIGVVELEHFLQLLNRIVHHPEFSPGFGFLTDYRNGSPMFSFHDLQSLAEVCAKVAQETEQHYKSAVVMNDSTDYSFAEIWRQFSCNLPLEEFKIFDDYDEAIKWVRKPGHSL